MRTFNEAANKNFEKLDLFTVAITRAHGKNLVVNYYLEKSFYTRFNDKKQEEKIM